MTFIVVITTPASPVMSEDLPGETVYYCNNIDYLSEEEYSPDPNDSTPAVPCKFYLSTFKKKRLASRPPRSKQIPASLTIQSQGPSCFFYWAVPCSQPDTFSAYWDSAVPTGQCIHSWPVSSFYSNRSGDGVRPHRLHLHLQIGNRKQTPSRSQLQPAAFEYCYGYSLILYVTETIGTKLTAVSCIFLFINRIQRHPQAYVNSNSVMHYPLSPNQNQYHTNGLAQRSQCSIHQNRSQSNSLRDVSNFYNFPPPPTISYQFMDRYNGDELVDGPFEDYSPSVQPDKEFVTFSFDQPLPPRAPSMVSINSRGTGREGTLRRTTPV
ncbi:hypothetical protein NQ317_002261 [Molorchus minor]|uniref:Uncharacterized protein n=1 Tax=Molorchus minor TaxID=1323400 RepID=A0ABQ9JZ14_9CUCU|nr:hypothetical protein NQ317_002261 [Molorchus minor]